MSAVSTMFKFGEFELDPSESSLSRSGDAVQITPKALRLLCILTENQGHLLDKSYLLDQIWPDSHVEEGNLTFNIRQLRKILGDEVRNPKYIETVPKRGYRFIGSVERIQPRYGSMGNPVPSTSFTPVHQRTKRPLWKPWFLAIPLIFAAGGFAAVESWFGIFDRNSLSPKLLSSPFSSEQLSTDGNVSFAALSKNGQFVVYVTGNLGEKQSVRIRDLETGQSREFIGSSNDRYLGIEVSNDDSIVYFVRISAEDPNTACLFKTKVNGGHPESLGCGIQGWFDLSNDGGTISYIRCKYAAEDYCSLFISDENLTNERLLVTRTGRERIADNAISPDGRSVVFAAGQTSDGSSDFGIYKIDLETNIETQVIDQKFFNVVAIDWMPDGITLLATALRTSDATITFWTVDPIARTATSISNGHDSFSSISINHDGSKLVSTTRSADFRVFVHPLGEDAPPTTLGNGWSPRFDTNGSILFASYRSGKTALWAADHDGTDLKHLSSGPDGFPVPSPDGTSIYFSSNRSGKIEVWKMKRDGSSAKQLSSMEGGFPVGISPDGFWIYYLSAAKRTLHKISNDGSTEEQISESAVHGAEISPDGRFAAFFDRNSKDADIAIYSLESKTRTANIPLPGSGLQGKHLAWPNNGNHVYAVLFDPKTKSNFVWRIPVDGTSALKIRDLKTQALGERSSFSVSRDEKYFAISMGQWKHDAVLIHGLK